MCVCVCVSMCVCVCVCISVIVKHWSESCKYWFLPCKGVVCY